MFSAIISWFLIGQFTYCITQKPQYTQGIMEKTAVRRVIFFRSQVFRVWEIMKNEREVMGKKCMWYRVFLCQELRAPCTTAVCFILGTRPHSIIITRPYLLYFISNTRYLVYILIIILLLIPTQNICLFLNTNIKISTDISFQIRNLLSYTAIISVTKHSPYHALCNNIT